jgi:hypothetical protein
MSDWKERWVKQFPHLTYRDAPYSEIEKFFASELAAARAEVEAKYKPLVEKGYRLSTFAACIKKSDNTDEWLAALCAKITDYQQSYEAALKAVGEGKQ